MKRMSLIAVLSAIFAIVLAACGTETVIKEVEVPGETIIVEKEVVKEVPVEVVVEKEVVREVIKEVEVPGATIVVEKEVEVERFNEAPMLTQLVNAGKLPPVEDRLPEKSDVLLIPALREIGKYGGTLRRVYIGAGDISCNAGRMSQISPLRHTTDGNQLMPWTFKGFEPNSDGSEWTAHLREGLKWSDGSPFTADDWLFSVNEALKNDEIAPSKDLWVKGPGPGLVNAQKIDDYTVKYSYPSPFWTLPAHFAITCAGPWDNMYVPGEYLKQFHIDHNPDADKLAKEAGFDGWVPYYKNRGDVRANPEMPTNQPWRYLNKAGDPVFIAERNPYYWAVDQEGNQLPYIDRLRLELVDDVSVLMLKAVQGEIDFQMRHIQLPSLPVLKQSEEAGGYRVQLFKSYAGVDAGIGINQSYEGPAGDLLKNKDFRIALSHALDREFMREVSFVGMGEIRNALPPLGHPHHPGAEYETLYTEYDVAKSNELLDRVMGPKDSEGFRTLPDGSRFDLDVNGVDAFGPFIDIAEQAAEFWKKVGIRATPWGGERSVFVANGTKNEQMVSIFMLEYYHDVFSWPQHASPVTKSIGNLPLFGPAYAHYYVSGGEEGIKPPPEYQRMIDIVEIGATVSPEESAKLAQELYAWHAENQVSLGVVGHSPMLGVAVVNEKLVNVPDAFAVGTPFNTPFNAFPEQFWFRD